MLSTSYESLTEYIEDTVEDMIKDRKILQYSEKREESKRISKVLLNILTEALNGDNETRIINLMTKIESVNSECAQLKTRIKFAHSKIRADIAKASSDSARMTSDASKIEEQIRDLEAQREQRLSSYNDMLTKSENSLLNIRTAVENGSSVICDLKAQLRYLKQSMKMLGRHPKSITRPYRSSSNLAINSLVAHMRRNMAAEQKKLADSLRVTLEKEEAKLESLKEVSSSLIEALSSIRPLPSELKETEDFAKNSKKLKEFIENSMYADQKRGIDSIKQELRAINPAAIEGCSDIKTAIAVASKKCATEAEERYITALKDGKQREKELRASLREALEKVKELQRSSSSAGIDAADMESSDMEQSRRLLDAKMEALRSTKANSGIISSGSPNKSSRSSASEKK